MSYTLKEVLANPKNYGGSRNASQIRYLVFHYTANDGDKAINNAKYFKNNIVKASAHYFVDDEFVYRSVHDLKVAWSVGGSKYANADKTGGAKMYGVINNTNSISIEMCDTIMNGIYQASDATLENAISLGKQLMSEYNIPIENVYRHFDVTGKHCPSYLINERKWEAFKSRLEDEEMDVKKLSDDDIVYLFSRYNQIMGSKSIGKTLKPEFEAAKAAGITDGSSPYGLATRAQVAVMVYRGTKK